MTARIARGSQASGRRPASRSGGPRKRSKKKQPGLLEGLPISRASLRALIAWGVALAVMVVAAATAAALRLPQKLGNAVGEQVGAAGFAVRSTEVTGALQADRLRLVNRLLHERYHETPMPLVDLDAIRSELLQFTWMKEARVSRRLPDTLLVHVVERRPVAIWQNNRQLSLIDIDGVRLGPVQLDAMPNLPLVIGAGAERRVDQLGSLIETAPRLRPLLAGATWIGDRRWDLRFRTGETLSLPEGQEPATRALRRFADMDQRRQLLGGSFLRFDMRIEGRMIVRLKPGQDGRLPSLAPPSAGEMPEDLARTI